MNDDKDWIDLNYDGAKFLPYNYSSYTQLYNKYYIRKNVTNEDTLERIPIAEIEKFLRRKKLEKLKDIE
jgi:hypothetical protein